MIIYEDENNKIEIEDFLYDETIWLPLNKISELFEKDKSDISRHINNIYNEEELNRNSTVANFATLQIEGNRSVRRNIDYIKKLQTYLQNVVLIIIKILKSQKIFMLQSKISFIMLLQMKQLLKLFIIELIVNMNIWD